MCGCAWTWRAGSRCGACGACAGRGGGRGQRANSSMPQTETDCPPRCGVVLNSSLLLNGLLYVNIHTSLNNEGELRGQLISSSDVSIPETSSLVASVQPLLTSSDANGTFFQCSFPFVAKFEFFRFTTLAFSSSSNPSFEGSSIAPEFQQMILLTGQQVIQISFSMFPLAFTRGRMLFVQAILNG